MAAIVSDAVRDQYDPSRANIGAHEHVVQGAFERGDVLPVRFGTVAQNDDTVQRFLRDNHSSLQKSLEGLHDRGEMVLKATWDQNAILKELLAGNETIRAMRDEIASRPEAETYDQRIELGRMVSEAIEEERKRLADLVVERLRPKAADTEVHQLLSETMVVNAGFLVERNSMEAFDKEVGALGEELRGKLNFKYVGPLPPYSFVRINVPKEG
ncbi:Gas vesicle synthesis GvpLGvpF [Labilithrix luteola]|uniref:Gas vesicle synthesis GvpLGvpF n=1 Tax=Labilithrix luteola TaxID=1391654 RepID=A0A0K1PN78_9BACT|nr:Gas vesicle synthesis GvpLGvpF [Labilithrix luteola]